MTEVEGGLDEPAELEPEQGALDLADAGDRWDRADWERAAAGVLRKARRLGEDDPDALVWERLTRTTLDDIAVTPLGTSDLLDGLRTEGRPQRAGDWDVRAHLDLPAGAEARAANETLLVDLEGGVTSLWLCAAPDADLATALDGVLLDLAPVVLEARGDATAQQALAENFLAHAGERDLAAGTNLGADPLGAALRHGTGPGADPAGEVDLAPLVAVARAAHERGLLGVVVDATAVHDRGASDAQELGWSMAVAAAYLRALTGAGLTVAEAAGLVEVRYAATDDQFATIAKLRAARRLWARVLELSGVTDEERLRLAQRQHVVTSRPMMSRYDPYVNMLRTTVAAFAAGVGGAEAVTVLPFDSPLGRPEALGRRIARNTSALLVDEAHVAHVADPAGGSYAVEKLTDDLAVAGWAELGRTEEVGGAAAALADGSLLARVARTVERRDDEVARRRRPLTGLTEFPQVDEVLPEREPVTPDSASGWVGVRPYGAAFEALRDDPPTARAFLATLGSVASHTARATFATNLLAAGGVGVDVAGATADVDALLSAYDGQRVAVLAGSDATYAAWGTAAARALREAGARHVVVAGKPLDGTDDACALGVDALSFLTRTREQLA
ncbi:methylmalonyl-CoA mutase family protein [Nocardioides kribbensis]|uniref:methylmalonyl-CoA mutase family protein n=1 Tax=Nocardioides kribbensis TaxID=305517 RepID=UPI0032DA4EA0